MMRLSTVGDRVFHLTSHCRHHCRRSSVSSRQFCSIEVASLAHDSFILSWLSSLSYFGRNVIAIVRLSSSSLIPYYNCKHTLVVKFVLMYYIQGDHCMENLEISVILTAVSEMSGILLKVRDMSGKQSCQGKVFNVSCIFASILDFAEPMHFIFHFGFRSCTVAFLTLPQTITLVPAWYE